MRDLIERLERLDGSSKPRTETSDDKPKPAKDTMSLEEFKKSLRAELKTWLKRNREAIDTWIEDEGKGWKYDEADVYDSIEVEGKMLYNKGYTVVGAFRWLRTTEQVDPRTDEADAIKMRAKIEKEYA